MTIIQKFQFLNFVDRKLLLFNPLAILTKKII